MSDIEELHVTARCSLESMTNIPFSAPIFNRRRHQEFTADRDGFQGAEIGHLSQLTDLQIHLLVFLQVAEAFQL